MELWTEVCDIVQEAMIKTIPKKKKCKKTKWLSDKDLQIAEKRRDITLLTKVCTVKDMFFPVVVFGCESWNIKLSTEELMCLNYGIGEDT